MVLSPSRSERISLTSEDWIDRVKLPSLAAGNGVAIGDRPERLRRLLGRPNSTERARGQRGALTFTYRYRYGKRGSRRKYEADYTFRNGRLWEINLQDESLEPG